MRPSALNTEKHFLLLVRSEGSERKHPDTCNHFQTGKECDRILTMFCHTNEKQMEKWRRGGFEVLSYSQRHDFIGDEEEEQMEV